jgi:2-C-methyl-D-erythritol 4-phosphate cytidylyltransferase
MENSQKCVIIVAGGSGTRMGTDVPKQFLLLVGKPILMHTIEVFYRFDQTMKIVVVLPFDQHQVWKDLCTNHAFTIPHQLASGGKVRFDSVKNGLAYAPQSGIIAIHDGVRPLVSQETIQRCFDAMKTAKAVIPVVPVTESVRQRLSDTVSIPVVRDAYALVQTPQVFDAETIHNAYKQPFSHTFTDDATVVENIGVNVQLVEGNFENIKITRPVDLKIAESLLIIQ